MGPNHAIDVVAQALVGTIGLPDWESFPDIGERDWEAVCQRMRELTSYNVSDDLFEKAFNILTERAKGYGMSAAPAAEEVTE